MCTQSQFILEYHLYYISYTSEKNTKKSNLWPLVIRFSNKPKNITFGLIEIFRFKKTKNLGLKDTSTALHLKCLSFIQPDHVPIMVMYQVNQEIRKKHTVMPRPRGWLHNAMMVTVCPSVPCLIASPQWKAVTSLILAAWKPWQGSSFTDLHYCL